MQVYGWTARVCGGAFLLVQIVVLLHAVYRWNDAWVGNFERYKWLLLLTSIALFRSIIHKTIIGILSTSQLT